MQVFFGAGELGRKALSLFRGGGIDIDFFCDNNPLMHGQVVENKTVISVDQLLQLPKETEIIITCKNASIVEEQLINLQISRERIRRCDSIQGILKYVMERIEWNPSIDQLNIDSSKDNLKVIFELSNGLAMGGVETWSIQTANWLKELGYKTAIFVDSFKAQEQTIRKDMLIPVTYYGDMTEWNKLNYLVSLIINAKRNMIICNFIGFNFMAACLAKRMFPNRVKVIAVVHNDEEVYFQNYVMFQEYIDTCFVISERIKAKLIERRFPKERILYLPWEAPCEEELTRSYSSYEQPLRIGYAGRIVLYQKRVDYLLYVTEKLVKTGIDFILEIAGVGSYENELQQQIEEKGLTQYVHFLGMVEHSKIPIFWKRQDIMVSCSDYEGHSITQVEAMSQGAVPVITDTSGARDDVLDGENGFVVEVGAVDQLVDRIHYLYCNRELVSIMGHKAYQTIKHKNGTLELQKLWNTILLE